jgi:hypothetical protein
LAKPLTLLLLQDPVKRTDDYVLQLTPTFSMALITLVLLLNKFLGAMHYAYAHAMAITALYHFLALFNIDGLTWTLGTYLDLRERRTWSSIISLVLYYHKLLQLLHRRLQKGAQ